VLDALRARAREVSPDTWTVVAIGAAVVLGNIVLLLGFGVANPLGKRSGLTESLVGARFPGVPTIDPNNGFVSQAVSHRAALDWLHLSLPWWNPYEGTGAPLAGEMQSAAFFPPTVLTALSNGQLYEHMLLEFVAGWSTLLLLRRLSLGRFAATAGGIAFALNGTFAWFSHATVNPVAFLPLALLGLELAYSAALDGRRGGWWLIPIAGALSFYAGFPEVAYIDALLAIFWFAWRLGCLPRERRRAFAGKVLSGAAVAALLAAPLLIAFVDFLGHADTGLHTTSVTGFHQASQGLSQLLLPYVFGPIFAFVDPHFQMLKIWGNAGGFVTSSLVLFALLGLCSRRHRGLRIALGIWILLAVARVYGGPPLIDDVLSIVPGMSKVIFDRYATSSIELSVIVLAALGIDDVIRAVDRRRVLRTGAVALALVLAAGIGAIALVHRLGSNNPHRWFFDASVLWAGEIVIAGTVIALLRNARLRARLAAALVALDAVVLFAVPELSAARDVKVDTAPATFLSQHLGTSRFFTLGPIQPNYGAYYGVASLNLNDLPIPKLFARFVHSQLDQYVDPTVFVGTGAGGRSLTAPSPTLELLANLNGYRAAGVKYVLTPSGTGLLSGAFKLVFESPTTWIYELSGSQPYFTVSGPGCTVSTTSRTAARVTCAHPTTLVRREASMPGWSAAVDGHSTPVQKTDGIFQSVAVAAGSHTVTFGFTPPGEGFGLFGFLIGLGWLALNPLRARRSRRYARESR
jgi:hypothetical protein